MHVPSSSTWKDLVESGDEEVWNQLRNGNHLALECIYRTYGKGLYHFGVKLYGKSEWVQDTLHELFVDLWRQHERLSAVASLKTYLFRAFKYKLQRQYGKEKSWIGHLDYEKLPQKEVEMSIEHTIIATQLSKEQQHKLVGALARLPSRQREVLHLLFEENLAYEEIAQIMGINIRSAYTLAWKGIRSLRKYFMPVVSWLLAAQISHLVID